MSWPITRVGGLILLLLLFGCSSKTSIQNNSTASQACALALAPLGGSDPLDEEISNLQARAKTNKDPRLLEMLGERLIAKARISHDPGFYKIAETCAQCLSDRDPGNPQALLLRGHVLHQMHRFKEAEALARQLVKLRRNTLDYGLLGDALMEQGKLEEATRAYQTMMDIKPFFQSYVRAAHMHWLKGDLRGALEIMRAAIESASARDKESMAWAYSRLAVYQLQAGALGGAMRSCEQALQYQQDYPAALLTEGRVLLAQRKFARAAEILQRAVDRSPMPESQWVLADAYRAAGDAGRAREVETKLLQTGESNDPRTLSLFLASRGSDVQEAVRLAREELNSRADVFTLDALAWSLANAGSPTEAFGIIERVLAEGTQEARLFYHAGVIAAWAKKPAKARLWLAKAKALEQMLLPSEREHLNRANAQAAPKSRNLAAG